MHSLPIISQIAPTSPPGWERRPRVCGGRGLGRHWLIASHTLDFCCTFFHEKVQEKIKARLNLFPK